MKVETQISLMLALVVSGLALLIGVNIWVTMVLGDLAKTHNLKGGTYEHNLTR